MKISRLLLLLAVAAALAVVGVACGSSNDNGGTAASPSSSLPAGGGVSGKISVMGVWSGAEQKAFQQVIDGFTNANPDVTVKYNSAGDQLPTVLGTAVQGGNPPDVAFLAQPGLMTQFASRGALKPIEFARSDVQANYAADWLKLGEVNGKLYGFVFKGANKSTVWYNTKVFSDAGVQPPATWDDLMSVADTISASGVPPYSIAGADGWTLTDLFENIYLRSAGPDKYDQLATHQIPWTDQSVKDALTIMGDVLKNPKYIAGGYSGALQTDFPTSVSQVFQSNPKAAMVFEGDFVQGVIQDSTNAKPGTDYNVFDFPSINGSANTVVGGGDTVVMFKDSPATQAFIKYLASPQAAEIWAKIGGFSSPNKNLDPSVYPDDITRATATALADAETFRFDMSDLAPADFGGTPGQGEWKILQDFLKDPSNVDGTAQKLEQAAAQAYKGQ